jgi:hypothetical protein
MTELLPIQRNEGSSCSGDSRSRCFISGSTSSVALCLLSWPFGLFPIAIAPQFQYSFFFFAVSEDPNLGTLGCYDGSSYPFLYRVGTSGRLSVYLEDGGACWDGIVSCNIPNLFNQNVNLNSVLATLSTRVGLLSDDSRSVLIHQINVFQF